jgi:hypothetical protein
VFSTQAFFRLQQGVFMLYLSIMGYMSGVGHLFYITRPSQYRKTVTAFSLTPPPRPGTAWSRLISLWKATWSYFDTVNCTPCAPCNMPVERAKSLNDNSITYHGRWYVPTGHPRHQQLETHIVRGHTAHHSTAKQVRTTSKAKHCTTAHGHTTITDG